MTKDEALKLALEALENMTKIRDCQREKGYPWSNVDKRMQTAVTAIKEALAQPEQELLFDWLPEGATHLGRLFVNVQYGGVLAMRTNAFKYEDGVLMVYKTDNENEYPEWREAKQFFHHLNFPVLPLYTTPPKREWVGLTEAEINSHYQNHEWFDGVIFAENLLKEKNT